MIDCILKTYEQEQFRYDLKNQLDASGYDERLKSVKARKYEGSNMIGVNSTEISHVFGKNSPVDHDTSPAKIFVSGLLTEYLEAGSS